MNRREIVEELIEKGYQAEVHDVIKNGVTFEGIMIRGEGAVAPIIYTNEVIKVAEANGASLSEVVDEVIREYKEHKKIQFNIDQFNNKKFIISHMYLGIQKASNEEIEKKMCELEGLESFLFIRDRDENGGSYSAKVNEQMLKLINVSVDEAWERAKQKSRALLVYFLVWVVCRMKWQKQSQIFQNYMLSRTTVGLEVRVQYLIEEH